MYSLIAPGGGCVVMKSPGGGCVVMKSPTPNGCVVTRTPGSGCNIMKRSPGGGCVVMNCNYDLFPTEVRYTDTVFVDSRRLLNAPMSAPESDIPLATTA